PPRAPPRWRSGTSPRPARCACRGAPRRGRRPRTRLCSPSSGASSARCVALPIAVAGPQAALDVPGLGEGRGLGELGCLAERLLQPLVEGGEAFVVDDVHGLADLHEPGHGVLERHVLLEQLLGNVLRWIVAGVALPPQRDALDERGPVACAGELDRFARG